MAAHKLPTSKKVLRAIEELTEAHRDFDERTPPKSWTQPMPPDDVDVHILSLVQTYKTVAPHLPRSTVKELRNLLRAHPFMRLRGGQAKKPPNYRLPNGKQFYWGGVRMNDDGSAREGGMGRKPQLLAEYEASPAGVKRIKSGEPTFYAVE